MKSLALLFCLTLAALPAAAPAGPTTTAPVADERPNVLFIAVDDLRTTLGCYGDAKAKTPNIDALARRGLTFNRAYCQQAVCNPSRQSLLTGRRPDSIRVWNLVEHFRQTAPDAVSLPQHFKDHGFHARSIGKVFHGQEPMADPPSWSEPEVLEYGGMREDYQLAVNRAGVGKQAAVEVADAQDEAYLDGQVAARATAALRELRQRDRPFFLAIGFRKPHLPFTAPRRYWDLYDPADLGPPPDLQASPTIPALHLHDSVELRGYTDVPDEGPIPPDQVSQLRHGYYACVSFMDAQVGKVLTALDEAGLRERTIVVLWSDHGFHLGERRLWAKSTNFEIDARVPLILSTPQFKHRGSTTNALVELVDLFPTLVQLCRLPMPDKLEGLSMVRLLDDPARPWKAAAFTQFQRPWRIKGGVTYMGYSVRTAQYRYVQWVERATGRVLANELYDHAADPHETQNLAARADARDLVAHHAALLHQGWPAALPPR
jgi:iduronate 2-sulfatase